MKKSQTISIKYFWRSAGAVGGNRDLSDNRGVRPGTGSKKGSCKVKKIIALLLAVAVVALFAYVIDRLSGTVVPWFLDLARVHPRLLAGAVLALTMAACAAVSVAYIRSRKNPAASPYRNPDAP